MSGQSTLPGKPSEWRALLALNEEERQTEAAARVAALMGAPPEERRASVRAMLEEEAAGTDGEMAQLIAMRLRALSTLSLEEARSLAQLFHEAEQDDSATVGMRRAVGLQNGCKLLTLEEVRHIEPFLPKVRQLAGLGAAEAKPPSAEAPAAASDPAPGGRRRAFWRLFGRT